MRREHENDPAYGWNPPGHPEEAQVPADLEPFYRQFKPGYWGYVCPCCHYVFPPGLGGMPSTFRVHVKEYLSGSGCSLNGRAAAPAKVAKLSKAGEF